MFIKILKCLYTKTQLNSKSTCAFILASVRPLKIISKKGKRKISVNAHNLIIIEGKKTGFALFLKGHKRVLCIQSEAEHFL